MHLHVTHSKTTTGYSNSFSSIENGHPSICRVFQTVISINLLESVSPANPKQSK